MNPPAPGKNTKGLRLALLALVALVAVFLLCAALYRQESAQIEQRLRDRESVRTALLVRLTQINFRSIADDLRVLADGDGLRAFLESGRPADLDRVIRRAAFFSRQHPDYDQLRFLDQNGLEIVRVNRDGEIVPSAELQNKSDRPYFQKTKKLSAGQIYVSTFDLNVEQGRIEDPPKPMLRFGTPVFDAAGHLRGVYLINYLGNNLISDLEGVVDGTEHRLRLLNARGYWLHSTAPDQEWGFMFPDKADVTVAHSDPQLWHQLEQEAEGQLRLPAGGLFTWQRVSPAKLLSGDAGMVVADEPFWILASEVSASEWADRFAGLRQIFAILTPGLLFLTAISLWFLRARQRAADILRRSEESLSVTLHSIGDAVLATDTDGKVTRLNQVAEQLTGWRRAEALGRPIGEIFRIVNEHTRQPGVIPVNDVLATGKISLLANHIVLISRDGHERAIADSAAPICDREGRIIGVVLVFRDVSQERAAAAKLTAALRELDRFFSLSLDFLCISSADGYFKRVSPAVTDILGWSVEEFLARPFMTLVHPDDIEATRKAVEQQVVRGEKVLQFENRYQHKDGTWRTLSWRSVPQPDGLMYATARDVTEAKRIETEIHRLNADLHRHAAQLEAANKELEAFSYSVSHDLRAPLRHVQGYVDMLAREANDGLSPKGVRFLQTIGDSARSMGQLIDDLLSFSRMGRAEMRETTVNLDRLVQEARKALELATTGREIHWKIADLPAVQGDAAMLRQVWANLLGNAVKYTRKRAVAEIEIGCTGNEGGRIVFFVRDNGAGFDMRYAAKLFGVFQRLHHAEEFEGTGIGLANVRRIIARHGGRTWAEGSPDAGATFYFTLKSAIKGLENNNET
ncbi:MAG TPA: PAS domain S-box protein [Lacunisphaera sp.]